MHIPSAATLRTFKNKALDVLKKLEFFTQISDWLDFGDIINKICNFRFQLF